MEEIDGEEYTGQFFGEEYTVEFEHLLFLVLLVFFLYEENSPINYICALKCKSLLFLSDPGLIIVYPFQQLTQHLNSR